MAQAEGPWTRAKDWAKLSGSALTMKLISPWRIEGDPLGAMAARDPESEPAEQGIQLLGVLGRVLDEFEAVGAGGVVPEILRFVAPETGRIGGIGGSHL